MRTPYLFGVLLLALPLSLAAQQTDAQRRELVQAAQAQNPGLPALLQGAVAARNLKDYRTADTLLTRARQALAGTQNAVIGESILLELASGGGIDGAQRAFRAARRAIVIDPVDVAGLVNTYPELLVGGELDETIERLSANASDPRFRCACYGQKAWMHRVAGNMERSRIYWDSAVAERDRNPPAQENATFRIQLVRDYQRAGRTADAQRVLQRALSTDRMETLSPQVRYNWAQAYSELRDMDKMVEVLDALLTSGEFITVPLLESRVSWDPVRKDPKFQALLDKHR